MENGYSQEMGTCPECGKPMVIKRYFNITKPMSPADILGVKRGFYKFFPHVDVNSECTVCNHRTHVALRIKDGQPIVTAGGLEE